MSLKIWLSGGAFGPNPVLKDGVPVEPIPADVSWDQISWGWLGEEAEMTPDLAPGWLERAVPAKRMRGLNRPCIMGPTLIRLKRMRAVRDARLALERAEREKEAARLLAASEEAARDEARRKAQDLRRREEEVTASLAPELLAAWRASGVSPGYVSGASSFEAGRVDGRPVLIHIRGSRVGMWGVGDLEWSDDHYTRAPKVVGAYGNYILEILDALPSEEPEPEPEPQKAGLGNLGAALAEALKR